MKESIYQSYDDLPLFLNAELIAKVFFLQNGKICAIIIYNSKFV